MASSDDFREQLKAGNITEALALALSEAVELKITTWVASAEDGVEAAEAKPGHRLHTRINMIEGDIENEIGEEFLGYGRYRELRQFHLDQVAEGNKIIQNNLKSLQKLFEVLVAMRYGSATAPTTESELLGAESQLLPPAESITDSGLIEELQESPPIEDVVVTPIPVVEDITDSGLVEEPQEEPPIEDVVVTPISVVEDITDSGLVEEPQEEPPIEDVVVTPNPVVEHITDSGLVEEPQEEPPVEDVVVTPSPVVEDIPAAELVEEPQEEPPVEDVVVTPMPVVEDIPAAELVEEPQEEPPVEDVVVTPMPVVEDIPAAELVEEPQELPPIEDVVVTPIPVVEEDIAADELVEEPQEEPPVEDVVVTPIPVVEEDIAEQQPPSSEEPSSLLTTPEDSIKALEIETDEDDWDDSVLHLLESLPVEPQPSSEALTSEIDEDWGDLIEEEPESGSASDLRQNRDWDILSLDDFEPPPASLESNIEASNSEIDEDWGDLIEEEPEPDPKKPVPSLESLDLEEDDEWDEWVVEEPEPLTNATVAKRSLLDLEEDEDWDDLGEDDPFAAAFDDSASELEIDENWDDFAAEELEPYPTILEFDADAGTAFDSSDPLENLTSAESAFYQTDNPDLSKDLNIDSSTKESPLEELDRFPQMSETSHQSQDASSDPIEAFFGETDADPVILDDNGLYSSQEELFAEMSIEDILADLPEDDNASPRLTSEEFEREVLSKDSDPFTLPEDELDVNPKSPEKRVPPPPPPPSRFPNQNN
jgi:hypothetical protein